MYEQIHLGPNSMDGSSIQWALPSTPPLTIRLVRWTPNSLRRLCYHKVTARATAKLKHDNELRKLREVTVFLRIAGVQLTIYLKQTSKKATLNRMKDFLSLSPPFYFSHMAQPFKLDLPEDIIHHCCFQLITIGVCLPFLGCHSFKAPSCDAGQATTAKSREGREKISFPACGTVCSHSVLTSEATLARNHFCSWSSCFIIFQSNETK